MIIQSTVPPAGETDTIVKNRWYLSLASGFLEVPAASFLCDPTLHRPSVDGQRYMLSFGPLDWVRNAQAASWAAVSRGRNKVKVSLAEIKPPESRSIVGEFARQIPAGVQFFTRLGLVEAPG